MRRKDLFDVEYRLSEARRNMESLIKCGKSYQHAIVTASNAYYVTVDSLYREYNKYVEIVASDKGYTELVFSENIDELLS